MMQIEIKEAVRHCIEESGISISPDEKDNVVALITEVVHKLDVEQFETRRKVREAYSNKIEKKRILPSLKGQKLHDFKNEFNTLFQTIDGLQFEDVSKGILQKFALAFATWGAYNLSFLKDQEPEDVELTTGKKECTNSFWHVTGFNDRQEMVEFLNKHKLQPEDFKFSDSGIGVPYTILYYSDKYLY